MDTIGLFPLFSRSGKLLSYLKAGSSMLGRGATGTPEGTQRTRELNRSDTRHYKENGKYLTDFVAQFRPPQQWGMFCGVTDHSDFKQHERLDNTRAMCIAKQYERHGG
ncbi:unnamed protein product [Arctogadus glacialis]